MKLSKNKRRANIAPPKTKAGPQFTPEQMATVNELVADRQEALLSRVNAFVNELRDEIKSKGAF